MNYTDPHVREYALSEDPMADDPHFDVMKPLIRRVFKDHVPQGSNLSVRKISMLTNQTYKTYKTYIVFLSSDSELEAVYEYPEFSTTGGDDYVIANRYMREVWGDGCPWRFKEPKDDFDEYLVVLRYYPLGHPELKNDDMIEKEQPFS